MDAHPAPATPATAPGGHRWSRWPAALAVVALVAVATACDAYRSDDGAAVTAPPTTLDDGPVTTAGPAGSIEGLTRAQPLTAVPTTVAPTTRPPAHAIPMPLAEQLGEDVAGAALVVPPPPPPQGTWQFIAQGADGPVSFNACRTIHYRVRRGPGPAGAEALVADAVARVSAVTGLRFVNDGPVTAVPTSASFPSPNATVSLNEAFAPVVLGWATREETDLWASEGSDTLGVGGPRTIVFANDQKLSVSGFALLTPSDSLAPRFGAGLTVGNVLLHELGHLVGLDHVNDHHELMQARLDGAAPDGYGPGDRRGLWELGASRGCASANLHPG